MKAGEGAQGGKTRSPHIRRNVDQAIDLGQIANHFHADEALSLVQRMNLQSKSEIQCRKAFAVLKAGCLMPALGIVAWNAFVFAAPPHIDLIELYPRDIAIHFETEANRKYELQYTDRPADLTNRTASSWTNLYVADSLPIPWHYVINDSRTNKNRFYRLKATP